MSKKNEITTRDGDALPAHLQDRGGRMGLQQDREHQPYSPPKLITVVSRMAGEEKQEKHGVGSLIMDGMTVATKEEPVKVVPVFYWQTWIKKRDNDDKGGFFIVEETADPNHEIAVKSRDPQRREEAYPDNPNWKYKHAESLNYIVEIQDGEFAGSLAAIKFMLGSHENGRRLYEYLQRQGVDIFCNVVEIMGVKKANINNTWEAIDFNAIAHKTHRYVKASDIERLEAEHEVCAKQYDTSRDDMAEKEG